MSDDEKQPKTTELPAVDPVLELLKEVRSEVRNVRTDVHLVANDLSVVKDRVGLIETRVIDLEAARARTSNRVREVSEHDLAQESKLADIIIWRQKTDEKLDAIHGLATDIRGALMTPLGKQAVKAVAVLLIAAATTVAGYTAGHEHAPAKQVTP